MIKLKCIPNKHSTKQTQIQDLFGFFLQYFLFSPESGASLTHFSTLRTKRQKAQKSWILALKKFANIVCWCNLKDIVVVKSGNKAAFTVE